MPEYRTVEGDTADLIVHRVLGRTAGSTEALLDANPGLAAAGPLLPAGLTVSIPAAPAQAVAARPLRLWE
jgi:phage tail protein X